MSDVRAPLAVRNLRALVDAYLDGLVFSDAASTRLLRDAMRHGLRAGSTRLRPVMALATADMLGRDPASVLPLAAALEMIHTHALMHEDLPALGDGDVRGGRPAAHVVFGEDVALLAADALFAEAIALILREQEGEPALVMAAAAELLQEVGVCGLLGGLYADGAPAADLDVDDLARVRELQTDHLLVAAVGTVVILSGEAGPGSSAARRFAAAVGVLSQIADDILEATAGERRRGASRDRGARSAKTTYVSAFGLERARELARASHAHASQALAEVPGDPVALQAIADLILARQA